MSTSDEMANGILYGTLKMLQEAAKYAGKTPERVDRGTLIKAAEQDPRAAKERGAAAQLMTYIPPAYPPCVTRLSQLEAMKVEDLKLETHHSGKALYLKTISPAWRGCIIGDVKVVAEDVSGEAVIVELHIVEREHTRQAVDIAPVGTVFVVREPYMYMPDALGEPQISCIRVDHVSDVLFLDKLDPRVPREWSGTVVEIPDAMELKLQGDDAIKEKKWHEAVSQYTAAFRSEIAGDRDPDFLFTIRLNRSLAHLHLGQYDAVLRDTDYLGAGSANPKALYRAASALYNLGDFETAQTCLAVSLDSKDDVATRSLIEKCHVRMAEQKFGVYDFAALRAKTRVVYSPELDHASFTSLVEVRDSPGKGRGLFLKKDVKAGDLVLCEKAVAYLASGASDEELPYHVDMDSKLVTKSHNGMLTVDLIQKLKRSPSVLKEVSQLANGNHRAPAVTAVDGGPIIDTFHIHHIIQQNSFGTLGTSQSTLSRTTHESLLFLTASYINHSCLANCTRHFIRDFIIVRADVDLKAGTELSLSYLPAKPLGERQETYDKLYTKTWGFECDCPLCQMGRSMEKNPEALKAQEKLREVITQELNELVVRDALEQWHSFIPDEYAHVPRFWMWQIWQTLAIINQRKDQVSWALDMLQEASGFVLTRPTSCGLPYFSVTKWRTHEGRELEMFLLVAGTWEELASRAGEDVDPVEAKRWAENAKRARVYAARFFAVAGGNDDGDLRGQAGKLSMEELNSGIMARKRALQST